VSTVAINSVSATITRWPAATGAAYARDRDSETRKGWLGPPTKVA
jgi:hypothetical protein